MQTFSLSFPFAGSKRSHFQGWLDMLPGKCTAVYEPFAGSSTFTFQILDHYDDPKIPIVWAEADPGMRAIWESWGSPDLDPTVEHWQISLLVAHLQTLAVLQDLSPRLVIGGKTVRVIDGSPKADRWTGADLLLRLFLRIVRDRLLLVLNNQAAYPTVEVAAAYAIMKRFAHGSIMRTNNSGGFNISLSVDKCKPASIFRWRLTYPMGDRPPNLQISPSAASLKYKRERNWINGAIALIDPPYYVDRNLYRPCTQCYPGHRPHDPATLQLCIEAVEAALNARVGMIIITNYYCPDLDIAISDLAFQYRRMVEVSQRGALKKLVAGEGNFKHGRRTVRDKKPEPVEWVWIIRRGFEQMNLFGGLDDLHRH